MYIYKYNEFIIESASDVMPELNAIKKMIFLIGSPGAGKTSFVDNFLKPKLTNYKIFDPDKYSHYLLKIGKEPVNRTKEQKLKKLEDIKKAIHRLQTQYDIPIVLSDEEIMDIIEKNIWVRDVDKLIEKQVNKFMTVNKYSDIVMDTTGNDYNKISRYFYMAKENNYSILIIKIRTDVKTAVLSNLSRGRRVQLDYQLNSIEMGVDLEKKYLKLEPDAFYVYDRNDNMLLKYDGDDLIIKKQRLIKNF